MTYHIFRYLGLPRQNPPQLVLEEEELGAGVDHRIRVVVGVEDLVVSVNGACGKPILEFLGYWIGILWRADDFLFDFQTCTNYQKVS